MNPEDQDKAWSDTIARDETPDAPREASPRAAARGPTTRPARMPLGVVVALGLAGLGLLWIIAVTFVQWRAQASAQETLRLNEEAQRQAQIQAEQIQREAIARQAQLQLEQQRQDEMRVRALAEQQRAADAAQRAEAEAAERKERAWNRFYQPPTHCVITATMDCTNRYIRAKRAFEEKYARGEL
jgi:hypothetical protein